MLHALLRLFDYDDWANREALASLKAAGTPAPRAVQIMAHILAVEWLWMGRLKQDRSPVTVWPEWTLEQCDVEVARLKPAWNAYLGTLRPEDLLAPVGYVNTVGEAWTNTVQDILTHVPVHSAYHRGQIAYALGRAGHQAAYTDFVHAVRRGFVE